MADCENVRGVLKQGVHQADSLIVLEAVLQKHIVALKHAAP